MRPDTYINLHKKDFDEIMFQLGAYKRECIRLRQVIKNKERQLRTVESMLLEVDDQLNKLMKENNGRI